MAAPANGAELGPLRPSAQAWDGSISVMDPSVNRSMDPFGALKRA